VGYTIKDIALRAGVSKSTVSRVISGKGVASPEKREKVLKVMKELQYKPNALARAMVSQRTNNNRRSDLSFTFSNGFASYNFS
jgi:DNA-binding LacI/PurR family transcriptional regulator